MFTEEIFAKTSNFTYSAPGRKAALWRARSTGWKLVVRSVYSQLPLLPWVLSICVHVLRVMDIAELWNNQIWADSQSLLSGHFHPVHNYIGLCLRTSCLLRRKLELHISTFGLHFRLDMWKSDYFQLPFRKFELVVTWKRVLSKAGLIVVPKKITKKIPAPWPWCGRYCLVKFTYLSLCNILGQPTVTGSRARIITP